MLPWVLAYDRYNYARYLTLYFVNMLNLESSHAEISGEFLDSNFAVQQSITNTFGKPELEKVIETTINKDTKVPGGTTGMITYF